MHFTLKIPCAKYAAYFRVCNSRGSDMSIHLSVPLVSHFPLKHIISSLFSSLWLIISKTRYEIFKRIRQYANGLLKNALNRKERALLNMAHARRNKISKCKKQRSVPPEINYNYPEANVPKSFTNVSHSHTQIYYSLEEDQHFSKPSILPTWPILVSKFLNFHWLSPVAHRINRISKERRPQLIPIHYPKSDIKAGERVSWKTVGIQNIYRHPPDIKAGSRTGLTSTPSLEVVQMNFF